MAANITELTTNERRELNERTSNGVCVAFSDHVMPPGVRPRRSRVGLERQQGRTVLLVERGLAYEGTDADVRRWLLDGGADFATVEDSIRWMRDKLVGPRVAASAPRTPANADPGRPAAPVPAGPAMRPDTGSPGLVTDLGAVRPPEGESPPRAEVIEDALSGSVFGQARAVRALAESTARHLNKPFPRRPASSLLVGRTGVGKTLVAETLASTLREVTAEGWRYTRLDMAEYAERHTAAKLTGAPPGYVGYGDHSLAKALADEPRHVVLFDEIEKAHPDVLVALMNLMDAGRLDSSTGGSVTAEKAVLLFTSNIGATTLAPTASAAEDDALGRAALREHGIRPEVVARFGQVLILGELTGAALASAAARVVLNTAADYGKQVSHIDPAYITALLDATGPQRLGIRALEHVADRELGPLLGDCPASLIDVLAGPTRVEPSTTAIA